jgi:hypothetical protein
MNIHPYHKSQPTAKAKRQATWKKVIHDVDVAKVTWHFFGGSGGWLDQSSRYLVAIPIPRPVHVMHI